MFKNFEATDEKLTAKLFSNVENEKTQFDLDFETFKIEFEENYDKGTFNKIFNNYYDNKNPNPFDLSLDNTSPIIDKFEDLFSKDKVEDVYTLIALENDKNVINSIADKTYVIKTFDYDGKKYKANEAKTLIPILENQVKNLKEKITQNDINIYYYFVGLAKNQNREYEMRNQFSEFLDYDKIYEEKFNLFRDLSKALEFVSTTTPFEKIKKNFNNLKTLESKLKEELKEILNDSLLNEEINEQNRKDLEFYIKNDLLYFNQNEMNI